MTTLSHSYCRNCPAACGLVIETEDNLIRSVRGDKQHPMSHGYMCVKGAMTAEYHAMDPSGRVARARSADGTHHVVDTAVALDGIARRLTEIVEEYGHESVALYHGTGVKMNTLGMMALKAWLRDFGSPYLYSSSTIDQSAKWVTAGRLGMFPTGKPMFVDSEVLMLVGVNPVISHMGMFVLPFTNPLRAVREGRRRGAKLIVVDPRRTETAQHADVHVQITPGQDVAFAGGMLRMIFQNGWHDEQFCARYVRGVKELRQIVERYTPEYVRQRAGIEPETLETVTRMFALSSRSCIMTGTGPSMSPYSNTSEHLYEALNAVCGRYRRPGDTLRNTGPFSSAVEAIPAQAIGPRRTWEKGPRLHTGDIGMISGEYPTSQLPAEMRGTESGRRIRALFVIGGNPVTALGEPETTLEAFRGLDLLVTVDPSYTETAALSDFYVPTTLPYEHADLSAVQDAMFEEPFVQVTRPQLEPPATVLDDWEFFWELNHRLGIPLTLQKAKVGGPVPESGGIPVDMETKPTTEALVRLACTHVGLDYDELLAHPSGMVVDRPPIRVIEPDEDNGERLDVLPPDVAEEVERYAAEAKSARPLLLVNRRLREVMNGAFHGLRTPAGRTPYNPAYMNLQEMERRGLEAGDLIAISSDYGEIVAVAEPDSTLGPGVVSIAHQWSDLPTRSAERSGSSFTGRLVSLSNHLEAVNYMPRQSAIPVSVARVET